MFPVMTKPDMSERNKVTRQLCDALYNYLTFDPSSCYPAYKPPSNTQQLLLMTENREQLLDQLMPLEDQLLNMENDNPTRVFIEQLAIPLRQSVKFFEKNISQLQKHLENAQQTQE